MTSPRASSAGVPVALLTVAIDAMGIGIVFPVMPDLLLSLGSETVANAALWGGVLSTLYAAMQFLFSPLLGALSDRFGRRPIMLTSLLAMAIDYVILSFAGGLVILLVGRAVAGVAGATYATATAYIADVSDTTERARRFGLVGAVFGLGFVLGPALGGLVGEWHVRAPFMLAAALAALNWLLAIWFLPESLPRELRRPFEWHRANPIGALVRALALTRLRWLFTGFLLFTLGNHVYVTIWSFWGKATFGWSVGTIGISLAMYGLGMAIVQGAMVRPVVARLGEARTIVVGLVFGAAAGFGFGFVTVGWIALALIPLAALSELAVPALTSMMSNRVGDDEQGELQGVLASLTAVAAVLMPPVATGLFYAFTHPASSISLPGAPFLLVLLLVGLCIPVMWRSLFEADPDE
ncbi:MAG: MFS transporter [Pseudomonadota bacterium]